MSTPSMCTNEDPQRSTRRLRGLRAASVLVVLLAGAGAAARPGAVAHQAASDATHDAVATDVARVLAGLAPFDAARYQTATSRPAWQAYREEIGRNWSRLDRERLAPMRAWSGREVAAAAGPCDTLFYPFGGPDLLNAYVLFPECSRYLLFGLEPVGTMPSLEGEDPRGVDSLVTELRTSLSDVFVRDYFITREMMTELKTQEVNGTLPLLLAFLARLDARIVDVRMESPWAEITAVANPAPVQGPSAGAPRKPPQRPTSVTIRFTTASLEPGPDGVLRARANGERRVRQAGGAPDVSRAACALYDAPQVGVVSASRQPVLEGASAVLEHSRAVLQDDTGVPFRFFDRNTWQLTLFGKYSSPVKDFNYGAQPDLEAAYREQRRRARPAVLVRIPLAAGHLERDAGDQEGISSPTSGCERPPGGRVLRRERQEVDPDICRRETRPAGLPRPRAARPRRARPWRPRRSARLRARCPARVEKRLEHGTLRGEVVHHERAAGQRLRHRAQ